MDYVLVADLAKEVGFPSRQVAAVLYRRNYPVECVFVRSGRRFVHRDLVDEIRKELQRLRDNADRRQQPPAP